MEPSRRRTRPLPELRRLVPRPSNLVRAAAAPLFLLLLLLPGIGSAQETGIRNLGARGVGVEAQAGVVLAAEGLSAVTEPGFAAGVAASVPIAPSVNVRLDGELGLPDRDVAAGPLINLYSGLASVEYVAQQLKPGRAPLRTALSLGGGLTVVEAAEMPTAAPAGASFDESYLTLAAGARLGYPVTRRFTLYLAPGVRWFDMPEADWERLTVGLGVASPESGWVVPIRAGMRIGF